MSTKSTPTPTPTPTPTSATEGSRIMQNPFLSEKTIDMGFTEELDTQVNEPPTLPAEAEAGEQTEVVPKEKVSTQIVTNREVKQKKDIFEIFTDFLQEKRKTVLEIVDSDLMDFLSGTMRFDERIIKLAQTSRLFETFFGFHAAIIKNDAYKEDEKSKKNIISGLLGSFLSKVENLNTEFTEKIKRLEANKVRFREVFESKLNEKFDEQEGNARVVGMSSDFTNLTEGLTGAFIEAYKQAKQQVEELDIPEFVQAFLSFFETSVFYKKYKAEYEISKEGLLTSLTLKAATAK